MFKMNSDTRNLGGFLSFKKNDYTILDVGCNNGALLLYASLKKRAKHYFGVDINDKALVLAKENMEINGINNYTFINSDILSYQKLVFNRRTGECEVLLRFPASGDSARSVRAGRCLSGSAVYTSRLLSKSAAFSLLLETQREERSSAVCVYRSPNHLLFSFALFYHFPLLWQMQDFIILYRS